MHDVSEVSLAFKHVHLALGVRRCEQTAIRKAGGMLSTADVRRGADGSRKCHPGSPHAFGGQGRPASGHPEGRDRMGLSVPTRRAVGIPVNSVFFLASGTDSICRYPYAVPLEGHRPSCMRLLFRGHRAYPVRVGFRSGGETRPVTSKGLVQSHGQPTARSRPEGNLRLTRQAPAGLVVCGGTQSTGVCARSRRRPVQPARR